MDGKRISQLTPDTSPSTDDYIVTVDGATTQNKRVELGSLPVSNPQNDALDLKLNISDNRVELRGNGFPQGVVSAPVGTTYVDTAATNGAIEWKKATGTGPTGWAVSVGDTGRRDVSDEWLAPGIAKVGVLRYQRIGKISYLSGRVQISTEAATGTRGSNKPLIIIDNTDVLPGWSYFETLTMTSSAGASFPGRIATINGSRQLDAAGILSTGNWTESDQLQINISWTETSPWLTSLPGSSL